MYNFKNTVIKIENTTICGAHCIMCPRENFRFQFGIMPLDCFKKIVDETYSFGIKNMIFGGFGDPLMDNKLEQRLEYVKINYPDIKMSMINTGHLLENENLKLVCKYLDVIKISNYSFSKFTYEKVHRGSLKYEKVKKNIDDFLNINKTFRPFTIMTFLYLPENHTEMEEWKKYYEPLCERIDIWMPHNWGGGHVICERKISMQCRRALKLSDLTFCADGSVSICCFDYNRELIIGNIMKDSLDNIINNNETKRIQRILESDNETILSSDLICKNCDQIRDRSDALIYTNDKNMQVGKNSMQTFE